MVSNMVGNAPSPADQINIAKVSRLDKSKMIRKVKVMYERREEYKKRWQEIRDYQLPYIGDFGDEDKTNPARRKDKKIVQGVAWSAAQKFAAGIMSGLTPPSRQWFKIAFKNLDTKGNVDIQKVLDERQAIIEAVMHGSNFYNAIHTVYLELPFGQCPMVIVDDPEHGIRCCPLTIGTYALSVDGYGKVNSVARKMNLTLEQLVDTYGLENLPRSLRRQAEEGKFGSNAHEVTWLVEPNENFKPGLMSRFNMPWRSVHWLKESASDEFLYVGGFQEWAIPIARYLVNGLEPYAKGPGWWAIGDAKQLQTMKRDYLAAVELSIKPPMGGPASLLNNGGINLIPGGFTPVEDASMGNSSVKPLFQVSLDLAHTADEIQRTEDRIKDAYASNLFVMLEQIDHGQMTAQEVRERTNEKLQQLGPVVERLQDEFLTAVIERIYGILDRAGAFPAIDPDLQMILSQEEIKIDYISPLAQAQKMSGLTVIEQGLAQAAQMAQLWPDTIKVINPEATIRDYLDKLGAPAEMMFSEEQVQAMKEAEQQAMMQQQAMEQGLQTAQALAPISQAAKNLTEAADGANPAMQQWLGMGVQ